jgi:beta-N-acetylhexosaminidase
VKHFPGHGATTADSHHEVPTLARSSAELEAVELPPFAAGIAAGTRAVMTGHLIVPSLDPDHLATVSPAITRELLRGRLGFTGTVVTDALEMRALADTYGMAGGFVAALAAGADAIETGAQEYPELLDDIPAGVARALAEGRLDVERLRDAAARTAALAKLSALPAAGTTGRADNSSAPAELSALPAAGTAGRADKSVWGRCIEVVGALPRLVRPLVVEARPPDGMASGALPWSFAAALAERVPDVEAVRVTSADPPVERAIGRTLVAVVRDPVRHPWQDALVAAADVVVDVGWPADLPRDVPLVRTRGVAPGLLAAAADILANA